MMMAKISFRIICGAVLFLAFFDNNIFAQQKDYPIQPVPFTQVHVNDSFWEPKMEVNANITIPYVLAQCKANGRVDNFLRAAKLLSGDQLSEFPFDDTDIYKVIEGASYAMDAGKNAYNGDYSEAALDALGLVSGGAMISLKNTQC